MSKYSFNGCSCDSYSDFKFVQQLVREKIGKPGYLIEFFEILCWFYLTMPSAFMRMFRYFELSHSGLLMRIVFMPMDLKFASLSLSFSCFQAVSWLAPSTSIAIRKEGMKKSRKYILPLMINGAW